jgi:predicted metal-dependent hydrolase
MKVQEKIYLYGYPIYLNLTLSDRYSRRFGVFGGQININVPKNYDLDYLRRILEKALDKNYVASLISTPFIGYDYVYVLGNKKRFFIEKETFRISMEDLCFKSRSSIETSLKNFALKTLTEEVRKYEQILNTYHHEVKVTSMRSACGKNYYKKHLITFDWKLIHFSLEIIDSVVIHELCHDFYQNHSKDFYALLHQYCPNYDELMHKLMKGEKK